MLSPPDDLDEEALAPLLAREWRLTAASLAYQPVGFGSYHWLATDPAGTRWFVTADDLAAKQHAAGEPLTAAFGRLHASLTAACDLRDCGRAFVVAPVRTPAGEPVVRASDRFALAVYPFVDGRSFAWGEFAAPEHRRGVLDLVVGIHTAPAAARLHAPADDGLAHRDELEAALDGVPPPAGAGPYADPAARLLAGNAPLRRLLARHDRLVTRSQAEPGRWVLTHGETHPGNTMLGPGGWLLIDWETAQIAPPERDLWNLDGGDGAILRAYADATGVVPQPDLLGLYRMRWDLADVAVTVAGFRRHHGDTADDQTSWKLLRDLVARIGD